MKKICYVNPTILLKRPIAELVARLGDKYQLSLLVPKCKRSIDSSLHYSNVKKAKVISYPTMQFPGNYEWPLPGLYFLKQSWKILKYNDIIHMWVPFYLSTSILAILKSLFFRNKKLILTMDTIPAYSFKLGGFWDIFFKIYYKTIGKIVWGCVDQITLYGKSFVGCAKFAGVPKTKIKITPTGIDLEIKKSDKDIRKEFGISKNARIILSVGICSTRKGADIFIKTSKQFKDDNVKFIWVGGGPEKSKFERYAKKLNVNNKIIFTDFRRDVHNFYNQADVFFFPSRGEGLAGVIMEAAAYKLPIITSKIAGTKDLIKNGKSGFLCSVCNFKEYSKKIKKILSNQILRKQFGKAANKNVKDNFNWEKNIKNFERIVVEDW